MSCLFFVNFSITKTVVNCNPFVIKRNAVAAVNLINPLINNALLLASCVGFSKTKSNVAGDAEKYINVKKKGLSP